VVHIILGFVIIAQISKAEQARKRESERRNEGSHRIAEQERER
jgi:hypothetical protein